MNIINLIRKKKKEKFQIKEKVEIKENYELKDPKHVVIIEFRKHYV